MTNADIYIQTKYYAWTKVSMTQGQVIRRNHRYVHMINHGKFVAEGRIKKYAQHLKQPKYCGKCDWWKQRLRTVNDKITI